MNGWEVLLPEALAARARETAREVAARLRDPERLRQAIREAPRQSALPGYAAWRPFELSRGHPGLAILFATCAAAFREEDWGVAAQAHLEVVAEAAPRQGIPPSLFHGLAGRAFARLFISPEIAVDQELLRDADGMADRLAGSANGVAVEDFDVVSGLAGIGAYLLMRADAPSRVLEALVHLARRDGPIPAWQTPPHLLGEMARETYPEGYLNCGLSHGIPGALALLALAERQGAGVDGGREAVERIAVWLAEQRLEDDWGVTWPAAVPLGRAKPQPTRSAWCYGPPGVARSLWHAGAALDDSSYRDLALEAMAAVYRRPVADRRIDSPTFCHGVAGLLQITLRFAYDTGLPLFRKTAAELATQLLDAYEPDSLLGYRDVGPGGRCVDCPSLVEGAAGVALVLLAASTSREPAWDRAFLLR